MSSKKEHNYIAENSSLIKQNERLKSSLKDAIDSKRMIIEQAHPLQVYLKEIGFDFKGYEDWVWSKIKK